jgi:predicted amidohydrolase YtcJ
MNRNTLAHPEELNCHFLDALYPDIPVALMSKDYHSELCNSLALKIAGIDNNTLIPRAV